MEVRDIRQAVRVCYGTSKQWEAYDRPTRTPRTAFESHNGIRHWESSTPDFAWSQNIYDDEEVQEVYIDGDTLVVVFNWGC